MKRALWTLFVVAACKPDAPPPAPPPVVAVERSSVATATMRSMSSGPRLSGTLQPQQSASIVAEAAGTVVSVSVAEGQPVGRGTPLARIADQTAADSLRSAEVAVQSAQTAVAVAQRDAERTTRLAAAGALAKRDAEVARAQVASAQAQLGLARSQLATARDRVGNQTVTASTSGIVSEKSVSTGDVVAPGTPLFTIVDLSTLQLEATVPSDAIGLVNPGTPVEMEVRGYADARFAGTITRVAPSVDPATGQVRVYVSIANQGKRLVGGLFAEGSVRSVSVQALVIPLDALDESAAAPAVLRLRNGVAERVTVQLGVRNETEGIVQVLSGLNPGDTVVIGPARTMTPGTKVKIG